MDEQEQEESIFNVKKNAFIEAAIADISKWSQLIAMIGFGIGAFVVVMMLFGGAALFHMIENAVPLKIPGLYGVLIIVFFIFFFIAAAVLYFLYKASQLLRRGVLNNDSVLIGEGFSFLKNFFIAMVIFSALSFISNITFLFQ